MGRREMLLEYFSFEISETGDVKTLPHLLREYTPNLDKLPMFLMRLGPQVCSTPSYRFTDVNLALGPLGVRATVLQLFHARACILLFAGPTVRGFCTRCRRTGEAES